MHDIGNSCPTFIIVEISERAVFEERTIMDRPIDAHTKNTPIEILENCAKKS